MLIAKVCNVQWKVYCIRVPATHSAEHLADIWSVKLNELPKLQLNIHLQSCNKLLIKEIFTYSIQNPFSLHFIFSLLLWLRTLISGTTTFKKNSRVKKSPSDNWVLLQTQAPRLKERWYYPRKVSKPKTSTCRKVIIENWRGQSRLYAP